MSENLQTITTKLWAMANELRGNMDAAEYKNYILAFMFYRYLSEHQEEYLVENNVIDVALGENLGINTTIAADQFEIGKFKERVF